MEKKFFEKINCGKILFIFGPAIFLSIVIFCAGFELKKIDSNLEKILRQENSTKIAVKKTTQILGGGCGRKKHFFISDFKN